MCAAGLSVKGCAVISAARYVPYRRMLFAVKRAMSLYALRGMDMDSHIDMPARNTASQPRLMYVHRALVFVAG